MNSQETYKPAVNWEFGMLVTPEHFVRQERFHEASLLWMLRYTSKDFGLVGGGLRLPEALSGVGRHDPIFQITQDEESLQITVSQCRGLTPSGTPVEITPETAVTRRFALSDLGGKKQLRIYLLVPPHEYVAVDGAADEHNPQMQTERVRSCKLTLEPHGEALDHALMVGALRLRDQGLAYEIDSRFFPPCLHMGALSELTVSWRSMVDLLAVLSGRFMQLHRAMQEYIEMARDRGIDSRLDDETLVFVRSVIPLLDDSLEECLDITQSPGRFLGNLRKLTHGAALHLSLSPPVRQYFDALRSGGEAEFAPALDRLTQILQADRRRWQSDDLAKELQNAERALRGIEVLERALEGKYIDFRVSPMLESMNFFFDRGGSALYKLAAKPARLQGFGDQMTFYFANIRLEGREKYRLILTAHAAGSFDSQEQIPVELGMNEGSGTRRAPLHGVASVRTEGQNNVEFDFDAPEVQTIVDLRVTVPSRFPVSGVLLFVRHRFYMGEAPETKAEAPREELATAFRPPLQPGGPPVNNRPSSVARKEEQYIDAPIAGTRRRRLEE